MKQLNKSAIFTAVGLLLTTNFAGAAQDIKFFGEVIPNTCAIKVNNEQRAPGSPHDIKLDSVLPGQLKNVGSVAKHKGFSILFEGCTVAKDGGGKNTSYEVDVTLEASFVISENGVTLLENKDGNATGVAFQLTNGTSGNRLNFQSGDLVAGTNKLDTYTVKDDNTGNIYTNLGVEYYAIGSITAGTVLNTVTIAVISK